MIDEGMVYTLELFKERIGVTDAEVEALVEAGLKVRHFEERRFVVGKDFVAFVEKCHDKPEKKDKDDKANKGHHAAHAEAK